MIDGYCTFTFGFELAAAVAQAQGSPGNPATIGDISNTVKQDFVTCVNNGKLPYVVLSYLTENYTFTPLSISNSPSLPGKFVSYIFVDGSMKINPIVIGYDMTINEMVVVCPAF